LVSLTALRQIVKTQICASNLAHLKSEAQSSPHSRLLRRFSVGIYSFYFGRRSAESCFFHQWKRLRVDRQEFLTIWKCNKCGQRKERPTRETDAAEIEIAKRLVRISDQRKKLTREFWLELRRGETCNHDRIKKIQNTQKQLAAEQAEALKKRRHR
jgi:ribosomal protein L37AE/L43A